MPVLPTLSAAATRLAGRPSADESAADARTERPAPRLVVFHGDDADHAPERELLAPAARGGRALLFPCLWLFISVVSAIDTYLTVRYQEHLKYHEENPVGRLLLKAAEWDPSLLIAVKFLGSTLVLGVITALYLHHRRVGFTVTAAVALFQLGLLGYLLLA